jgi:hypothetical protein
MCLVDRSFRGISVNKNRIPPQGRPTHGPMVQRIARRNICSKGSDAPSRTLLGYDELYSHIYDERYAPHKARDASGAFGRAANRLRIQIKGGM